MGKFKVGDRVIYKATHITRTARYEGKKGTVISGRGCSVRWDDGEEVEYLIEENLQLLPSSPIVTETVRRIKPGVYGRLEVGYGANGVLVGLTSEADGKAKFGTRLSAPELRELARVALEIAEYLDAQ